MTTKEIKVQAELLQLPSTISKIISMSNRSLRVQIDTQENLSNENMANIMGKLEKTGWFCFLEDSKIEADDVLKLPPLPKQATEFRSPSQKLRGVIYVLWEQAGKKGEFELFYARYMEKIINAVKERLS